MIRLLLWFGSKLKAPVSPDACAMSAKIPERKADPYERREGGSVGSSDEISAQCLFLAEAACKQLVPSCERRGLRLLGIVANIVSDKLSSVLLSLSILWRTDDMSAAMSSSAATYMATEQELHGWPSPQAKVKVVFLVVALN